MQNNNKAKLNNKPHWLTILQRVQCKLAVTELQGTPPTAA